MNKKIILCLLIFAVSLHNIPEKSAYAAGKVGIDVRIQRANVLVKKGLVNQAIPLYKQAIIVSPKNSQAYLGLAKAYQKAGSKANIKNAIYYYHKTLELDPKNYEALSHLGELYSWDKSKQKLSEECYRSLVSYYPQDLHAKKALVQVLEWEGKDIDAIPYYEQILAKEPNNKNYKLKLANGLVLTQNYSEALSVFNALDLGNIAKVDTKYVIAYGMALKGVGELEEAKNVFEGLVEEVKNPQYLYIARENLASVYFDLKNYEQAFAIDSNLDPQSQIIKLRIARSLEFSNRIDEAYTTYKSLMMEFPDSSEVRKSAAYFMANKSAYRAEGMQLLEEIVASPEAALEDKINLAGIYSSSQTDKLKAINLYKNILTSHSMSGEIRFNVMHNIAKLLMSEETMRPEAVNIYRQLIQDKPSDVSIKVEYGTLLSWMDEYQREAVDVYLGILGTNPDYILVEEKLDEVLGWIPPEPQNLDLFEKVLRVYPSNNNAIKGYALIIAQDKNRFKEAVSMLEQVVSKDPQDKNLMMIYADVLASNNAYRSEAIKIYKNLLAQNPNDLNLLLKTANNASYDQQFGYAVDLYNKILSMDSNNRDALTGMARSYYWSGNTLKAITVYQQIYELYPDDAQIGLELAELHYKTGRKDQAIDILNKLKGRSVSSRFVPEELEQISPQNQEEHNSQIAYALEYEATDNIDLQDIANDLERLKEQLNKIDEDSYASSARIKKIKNNYEMVKQGNVTYSDLHPELNNAVYLDKTSLDKDYGSPFATVDHSNFASTKSSKFGDSVKGLEKEIQYKMRPEITSGFVMSNEGGHPSTDALEMYGFPTVMSLNVTPQLRTRSGFAVRTMGRSSAYTPSSMTEQAYMIGANYQPFTRLILDGDVTFINFSGSPFGSVDYSTSAKVRLHDKAALTLGLLRRPFEQSLYEYAGYNTGPLTPNFSGQVRDNVFSVLLNTNPLRSIDFNFEYQFAWQTGEKIADNYRNQFGISTGKTFRLPDKGIFKNTELRTGYQFLAYGYDKYQTGFPYSLEGTSLGLIPQVNGVGVIDPRNLTGREFAVFSNNPIIQVFNPNGTSAGANSIGGYFSPSSYFLNALRLGLMGTLGENERITYKLGGSLGVQAFNDGGRPHSNPTTLASAFDASILVKITDSFLLNSGVQYLDSGGAFSRWRFASGVIIRPYIQHLTPVFK